MYNLKLFIGISRDWIQPVMPISLDLQVEDVDKNR